MTTYVEVCRASPLAVACGAEDRGFIDIATRNQTVGTGTYQLFFLLPKIAQVEKIRKLPCINVC